MLTRSQTKYQYDVTYEVNINFEEASQLWKANKTSTGNGTYKYVCQNIYKTGKKCAKNCLMGEDFCSTHIKNKK